jgi:hypothetical protein
MSWGFTTGMEHPSLLLRYGACFIEHPSGLLPILLKARCGLQCTLSHVHCQIEFVVLHCFLDSAETHRDVLFTGAQKSAYTDD